MNGRPPSHEMERRTAEYYEGAYWGSRSYALMCQIEDENREYLALFDSLFPNGYVG